MTPRELVEAWVEAFNRSDADGLAAFYSPDAVNHQVAEQPVAGREAIREMFRREFAAATMVCIPEQVFSKTVTGLSWNGAILWAYGDVGSSMLRTA
jgi:uncharacterized protein (TIGR02246 family)